ncbi:MAG: AI-2E family transporter [Oscillibacter sp.]|nr:AI-2E family transporter [Oscillibacter sp.]
MKEPSERTPVMKKNVYARTGLTVFCTVAAILLFYDTFFASRVLLRFGRQFLDALKPILYGLFMGYLLVPVVNFFETSLFPGEVRTPRKGHYVSRLSRGGAILLTWLLIALLFYLLGSFLLPELYKSVVQLVSNIETYYNTIYGWVNHLLENNPTFGSWVTTQMNTYFNSFVDWLTKDVLPQTQKLVVAVSGGVWSMVNFVMDMLVGVIVSVYILMTKERAAAHARKVVYGLFSAENVPWVFRTVHKIDHIFSGFVRGKLLDSLIIGILCFVCCSLLKFPYTPLVSVIVGFTNVIPFFGPFLGAIPSTFLILLVSPIQAVYFVIFVLVLQQLDGNVIGPRILGDSTGLSSIWVITAILVGGSFFGVAGMFFGVPVCACAYNAAVFFVDHRLKKKDLPLDSQAYLTDEVGQKPSRPAEKKAK